MTPTAPPAKKLLLPSLTVIPSFLLTDVAYYKPAKSALEMNRCMHVPTLAHLIYAFAESEDYRADVLSQPSKGEWTATYIKNGKTLIERPSDIRYNNTHNEWIIEGGRRFPVELPPEGFVTRYDKETGLPCQTVSTKIEAEKAAGPHVSYFWPDPDSLRIAARIHSTGNYGPCYINLRNQPDVTDMQIGARSCEEDIPTPFLLTADIFNELVDLYKKIGHGNKKMEDLIHEMRAAANDLRGFQQRLRDVILDTQTGE